MDNLAIILAIIAVVCIAAAAFFYIQLQKTRRLKSRFGPEYDRTVQQLGNSRRAEAVLDARAKRVASYHIRPLNQEERARFAAEWRAVQERFVDNPSRAVSEADQLINEALRTCGYPMNDFDQQAADLSVDHADVVDHYRTAHEIARRSRPSTEDLRVAMQHYRTLFEDLIDVRPVHHEEVTR